MPPTARAETVGSLLRPEYLKQARQERLDGRIEQDQLAAVEDRAVRDAIGLQQAAGLDVITDGEMRRVSWISTIPIEHDAALAACVKEASEYVPLERLAIGPQCGFNSAGEGNRLSPAEQEAKL